VAVAALLGIIGQLLFFDVGLGVNLPIAIGLLLLAGWLVRRRTPSLLSLEFWLAPLSVLFAAFAAVRADPVIEFLDLLTSLGLAAGWLAALGGLQVIARPFWSLVALGFRAAGWASGGAIPALLGARERLPSPGSLRRRLGSALPVARGLAIAVPVVLVFIALFSAADAVFSRVIGDLFGFDLDLGDLPVRVVLAMAFGWVVAGALAFAAADRDVDLDSQAEDADGWKVGTTEAVTVLSAVAAVFLLFVILQGAYLFGGRDTMQASGIGYAEYARRGFFELVAVAFLAGGLVIGS
jgi:hypothetical protein